MPSIRPSIDLQNLTPLSQGRQVEWESLGDGPPLMWVEGGPGLFAHLARPDARFLSRWFRCYLVNGPGAGRTSPAHSLPDGYSLPSQVAFFEEARTALGLGRIALAGHSWGGLVAAAWAATHSDSVDRLIVIDGYAGGASVSQAAAEAEREGSFERIRHLPFFPSAMSALEQILDSPPSLEPDWCDLFNSVWPLYFSAPESAAAEGHIERLSRELRINLDFNLAWDRLYEEADHRLLLAGIRCPTLVIVGEHDFVCGPVWNEALAEVIPGVRYVVIPDAGHIPHYEQPEAVASAIEQWLKDP